MDRPPEDDPVPYGTDISHLITGIRAAQAGSLPAGLEQYFFPMRKHLLSLLVPALLGLPAAAQEFHFSGGYNASNVREAGSEAWSGRPGYQFGADLLLGNRWFVKPGAHFMVRELRYTRAQPEGLLDQEFRYTSRSLAVPLMLGLNLIDPSSDPALNVYALGGPTALMNLSADLNNDELSVDTRGTQWYLGFGAGIKLGFLFAEGGYNVAMTNVFDGDGFETNPHVNTAYAVAGIRLMLAD